MNTANFNLPKDVAKILVDPIAQTDLERLHAAYTWMRANNAFGRATIDGFDPFWVVTKHADVSAISRDNNLFHNGDYSLTCRPKAAINHIIATTGCPHIVKGLVHSDGDEHKNLRALTQAWFMPNSLLKLDGRIRTFATSIVDKLQQGNGNVVDFAKDIALYYPLHVIMDILGVPPEDEPRMLMLTQELFASEDPELKRARQGVSASPSDMGKALMAVVADFNDYFERVIADRRTNPRNDVATLLANAVVNGKPLSNMQRIAYFLIIATAGHDTTSSSSAIAMWALSRFPELLPRLKADPSLIPQFVDEALRFASPVRHFMRTATADTEIRGRTIRKGDWLMLCYGSANRDEEVFENPFHFNIDRKPNRHLAFGIGGHVCLGQHLAKLEMRILFEELIPRLQSVEPAGEMDLVASCFIAGPKHLPVRCIVH
ncbi:cytochrome P450 [Cupriavidus alkaliphilus]|uniref:cytochrome P450 n=1 Tax=Cupriavidus alkaliphilus TaxID=942866 RepID=UPI00339D2EA1